MANGKSADTATATAARLRSGRHRYADDLRSRGSYWYFSATTWTLRRALLPLVARYVTGRTLDAGAGGQHGRQLLAPFCREYVSADLRDPHGDLDLLADIQDLGGVETASFDTVFCSQVLEHVPGPAQALREFHRVLKPGGCALIAVPHLSALHEEPHDYYRYTPHGLRHLLAEAGFEVVELQRAGGLFTFVSHPVSYLLNAIGWPIPGLRWLFWAVNVTLVVLPCAGLDALFGLRRLWPTNVIAVGRKA